jgi:hypothetical protein
MNELTLVVHDVVYTTLYFALVFLLVASVARWAMLIYRAARTAKES